VRFTKEAIFAGFVTRQSQSSLSLMLLLHLPFFFLPLDIFYSPLHARRVILFVVLTLSLLFGRIPDKYKIRRRILAQRKVQTAFESEV